MFMCGNTHIGMCGCHLKPELWHPLEEGGIQVVVSRLKSNLGVFTKQYLASGPNSLHVSHKCSAPKGLGLCGNPSRHPEQRQVMVL